MAFTSSWFCWRRLCCSTTHNLCPLVIINLVVEKIKIMINKGNSFFLTKRGHIERLRHSTVILSVESCMFMGKEHWCLDFKKKKMCSRHFFHPSLKYNPLNVCFALLLREKQIVMIAWMMMMLASTVFCRFSRPPSLKWSRTKWKKEREKKMFPRFSSKSDENHASPMENFGEFGTPSKNFFFHNFPNHSMNDAKVIGL